MDETGKVLGRQRAETSHERVLRALGRHGDEPMKAVLEAGYGWGPLYDWIGEVADEVLLAHPAEGQGHSRGEDPERPARLCWRTCFMRT